MELGAIDLLYLNIYYDSSGINHLAHRGGGGNNILL